MRGGRLIWRVCSATLRLGSALTVAAALLVTQVAAPGAQAAPPEAYYQRVDVSDADALRRSLHEAIDDHRRYPYTSGGTDTWDILELAQEDPSDPENVITVYLNASYPKAGGGNDLYNREHTWPSSYGFPDDNGGNYPFADCHLLFLANDSYNTSRGNTLFRYCDATCQQRPTEPNDGRGGGAGGYPGDSNWRAGTNVSGTWEVWWGRRGDVARALLYADVRYEGGLHGASGRQEPDLILCDDEQLIGASATGLNEPVAYMGMLSALLSWHREDPVDDRELLRNEVVFSFQGNRNPFVDHPEWADCVFEGRCGAECGRDGQCADGDRCTLDSCDRAAGVCVSEPLVCGAGERCVLGACAPTGCDYDGVCEVGEDCGSCAWDCISGTGGLAACGNGVCEAGDGEDCVRCPADCAGRQGGPWSERFCCGAEHSKVAVGCSDPRCTLKGLRCRDLPAVAEPFCCGDGVCAGGPETCRTCPADCRCAGKGCTRACCGDGQCVGETVGSCPTDCGDGPAAYRPRPPSSKPRR